VWGSSVAAPIWADFMEIVTDGLPVMDFPPTPRDRRLLRDPRKKCPTFWEWKLEDALKELYEAGFDAEWEYVNSDEPQDEVVAQDPEHPARMKQGEKVKLEVSNGKSPEAIMPAC